MYTIGQISEMFQLPISTLRYYDKEGLFPDLERSSGIRRFSEKEIEALRVIECLKKSGLEIKDIKLLWNGVLKEALPTKDAKNYLSAKKKLYKKKSQNWKRFWICFNSNAGTMIRQSKTGTKTESKAFCPIVSQKTFRKYTIVLTMINRREMFPF